MKRILLFAAFAAVLPAGVIFSLPSNFQSLEGEPIRADGNFWVVEGGGVRKTSPVYTGGAEGMFICWEEPAWEVPRKVLIAIEGEAAKPVLWRSQVSHAHACTEIHADVGAYRKKRSREMTRLFTPLPDPLVLGISVPDGKPLKVLAGADGEPRVWLMRESLVGDDIMGNLFSLIRRASQYKPVLPAVGYVLFVLWFPLMLWTGYWILRLGNGSPDGYGRRE